MLCLASLFYAPSSRGIPAVFHSPPGERAARTVKLTRRADDDCIDARGRATQAQLPNALLALALALGFGSLLLLWRARCALTGSRHSRRACAGEGMDARGRARQEQLPRMSEGWPTRRGPVRRQSTDGLSANPEAGPRTWSTGTVRKARVWGGLLFTPGSCPTPCGPASLFAPLLRRSGYFLLATQEKVTRSPGGE